MIIVVIMVLPVLFGIGLHYGTHAELLAALCMAWGGLTMAVRIMWDRRHRRVGR